MKRFWLALAAATLISTGSGCSLLDCCGNGCGIGGCSSGGCGDGSCGPTHPRMAALKNHMHGSRAGYQPDFGPPSAAIAYPYYTTRGPRDFFEPNPPSIGR